MGPLPQPTLEDLKPMIEEILASVFGGLTSEKAVMADAGIVPSWRVRLVVRDFLGKQADTRKRVEKLTRRRQRDIDHDKFKEIVDGRTSSA